MNVQKIKIAMLEKGITVIEMSKLLDVNINTVSRWVNGKHLNSIEKFLEMLEILNLEIKDIK